VFPANPHLRSYVLDDAVAKPNASRSPVSMSRKGSRLAELKHTGHFDEVVPCTATFCYRKTGTDTKSCGSASYLILRDDAALLTKDQLASLSSGKVLGTCARFAAVLKPLSEATPLSGQISLNLS